MRRNIIGLKAYQPGKPIEEVKRELGLKRIIKMASNENAFGPSPKAVKAIRGSLDKINRYPDASCFYLRQKLAGRLRLRPSNIVIGNGSDELIVLALRAFLNEGEEVIVADTTFLIYKIASQIAKAKIKVVPMRDFKYDLKAMRRRISKKTKLIFIANPDNPTGSYVNRQEVEEFLADIPKDILVYFDEAYYEFGVLMGDFPDTLRYLKKKNIIITRTFSKAYGLSGLRIGYGISNQKIVRYLNLVREPFNVNVLAQIAAISALDDESFLDTTLRLTKAGKDYLYREFEKMDLEYVPSATNFILVDVKRDSRYVFSRLLSNGIIVRDMKPWGLDTYIRVTVGTLDENRRFINMLRRVL